MRTLLPTFSQKVRTLCALSAAAIIGFSTPSYAACGVSNTGLVAHWEFEDGSGTSATDSSGNGITITTSVLEGSNFSWLSRDSGLVNGAY